MAYLKQLFQNIKDTIPLFTVIGIFVGIFIGFNGFPEDKLPVFLSRNFLLIYLYILLSLSLIIVMICILKPLVSSQLFAVSWQYNLSVNKALDQNNIAFILSIFCLIFIGIIMTYSSNISFSGLETVFLRRHIFYVLLSIIFSFFVFLYFHYSLLKKITMVLTICTMILLAVGVAGFYTKVVDRWLVTSNFAINYFEITKFTFLTYWACVLDRHKITFFSIIPGALLLVLIFLLGSKYSLGLIILLLISLILMLIARFSSSIAAGLLVVFQFIYLFILSIPLYKESQILGGVLGVGLGESKYKILFLENTPDRYFEAFSDSIFRITLEEFGVVGAILIILLFLIYTLAGLHITVKIQDLFGRLLVFGVIGVTSLQAFQNFGISISAIPFEGISLPFIGYGGTQSLVNMLFAEQS